MKNIWKPSSLLLAVVQLKLNQIEDQNVQVKIGDTLIEIVEEYV